MQIELMGYQVFTGPVSEIDLSVRPTLINMLNPHSYVVAKGDRQFSRALEKSRYLFPDGSGIVLAARLLRGVTLKKVPGFDLHQALMQRLEETGRGTVFYLGSSEEVLGKIRKRVSIEYPSLKVETLSPPYSQAFTSAESSDMVKAINEVNPDLLFVGMTAPKQEKWVAEHSDEIQAGAVCSIGAVFDFYAGTVKRPSQFWLDLHLEWLVRLLGEPRRLWRRNLISTPLFLWEILIYKVGLKR